jgi:hypothetical protein
MKTVIPILVSAAILLSACSASSSSSRNELRDAEFEKTASLIESGSYQFIIRSASPAGGRTIQITTPYSLKAENGSFEAYLPYFGRAYSGAYGDGGGIEFKGTPEDLKLTRNEKKRTIAVKFTIRTDGDNYTIDLNLGSSGFGNLAISSQKRQSITYAGSATELND